MQKKNFNKYHFSTLHLFLLTRKEHCLFWIISVIFTYLVLLISLIVLCIYRQLVILRFILGCQDFAGENKFQSITFVFLILVLWFPLNPRSYTSLCSHIQRHYILTTFLNKVCSKCMHVWFCIFLLIHIVCYLTPPPAFTQQIFISSFHENSYHGI